MSVTRSARLAARLLARKAQASSATSSPMNGAIGQAPLRMKLSAKAMLTSPTAIRIARSVCGRSGGLGRKTASSRMSSSPAMTRAILARQIRSRNSPRASASGPQCHAPSRPAEIRRFHRPAEEGDFPEPKTELNR
ncbi:MAG: hypothetical protein WDM81_15790 [Rhizomicrobium sp.]